MVEVNTISERYILRFLGGKFFSLPNAIFQGKSNSSLLETGMQWTYFQDAVIKKRGILQTKGRKNKKKVAAIEGDIRELV